MVGYTKLFSDILASSIWSEPDHVRIVWITMLAMADRDGVVNGAVPGLAHMARVSLADCERALAILSAPDAHSRTKDHDGRRIATVDGGWLVLNYERHRDRASPDEKRAKDAERQQRKRDRAASRRVTPRHGQSRQVTPSHVESPKVAQAEAEAEAEAEQKNRGAAGAADRPAKGARGALAGRPDDVPEEVWRDWQTLRARKRAPISETVVATFRREAAEAGMTLAEAISAAVAHGWSGFRASWVAAGGRSGGGGSPGSTIVPKSLPVGSYLAPGEDPAQTW